MLLGLILTLEVLLSVAGVFWCSLWLGSSLDVCHRIVLKHFCDDLNSGTQGAAGNKQARSKTIVTSCLEAFHLVISIFCNRFPNKLSQVLLAIGEYISKSGLG